MRTIYTNGEIITVDRHSPQAEAVVVSRGRILFAGSQEEAMRYRRGRTRVVDLAGKVMLPGFIDAHSHFLSALLLTDFVDLSSPPAGSVTSIHDVQELLRKAVSERRMKRGATLLACGYDHSRLSDGRDPTRDDLDAVSREHCICIMHQSAHTGVVNSAVLEKFAITESTPDSDGGIYQRYDGSNRPNGRVEEHAFQDLLRSLVSVPGPLKLARWIRSGVRKYSSFGITTAQEGALEKMLLPIAQVGRVLRLFAIDIVAYCVVNRSEGFSLLDRSPKHFRYRSGFRIGGAKYLLDGSPQRKTAWLSAPYLQPPPGRDGDYCGYPVVPDAAEVTAVYEGCIRRGLQVLTHANGDAACEQLITCYAAARENLRSTADLRPVMIHAQTVREDQLDRMTSLGMIPSFFVAHTFFWGDWHRDSVLGEPRAGNISPLRWARERNMPFTLHQDSPVVPPDMLFTIWSAVTRETRSGKVLGEHQRIPPMEAVRAVTLDAACQYGEEQDKGSIERGKVADFVILDRNPLTVPSDDIRHIRVVETIKSGRTIYRADRG